MELSQADKQEIINAVLASIRTNSRTISQLTPVAELNEDDYFEVSGDRRISYTSIRDLIVDSVDIPAISIDNYAIPPTITVEELDTFGTDGSFAQMKAILKNPHTRFKVIGIGGWTIPRVIGILDVFSDSLNHVLTEILTTHGCFENGRFNGATHTDASIRSYFRSFNFSAPSDFLTEEGEWTLWQEVAPEGLKNQVNAAVDDANAAKTAAQTALAKATEAYPPTLTLSQLDTMGTSGILANRDAILKNPHTRYRVVADGWNPNGNIPPKVIGFVDVFSDSLRHVITQEITTHDLFDDQGNLTPSSHTDTAIRTYYRSFNLNASEDFPTDVGQWTKWKEKVPEGLRAQVYEALTLAKKALELSQTGSPTVEFSGFVSSVQLQPMSVSMSSTDPGYCAVFDSSRKRFLLKSASGSYYNNWGDGDRFGTSSTDGRIPQTGKIYADTISGNWYRWDGTNLLKFNSGVADPALKDTIITNDEIDDLIESLEGENSENKPGTNQGGGNSGDAEENNQPGTAVPGGNDNSESEKNLLP